MASGFAKGLTGALGGAGTGAAIGSAIPGIGTAIGAGVGGLLGLIGGASQGDDQDPNKLYEELKRERERSKSQQLGLVNQLQGPQMSPAMRARIKALQDQSQVTNLAEDPFFQGQRATLVQGGQQALSGIQNVQRARGVRGGFSNVGSVSDVYDRLGAQLAQLGQQAAQSREQKALTAAQLEQAAIDAQQEFQNAQMKLRIAIESGDSAATQQALQDAFYARQKAQDADAQMLGTALGGAASLAGQLSGGLDTRMPDTTGLIKFKGLEENPYWSGPNPYSGPGFPAPAASQPMGPTQYFQQHNPFSQGLSMPQRKPWSVMRQ